MNRNLNQMRTFSTDKPAFRLAADRSRQPEDEKEKKQQWILPVKLRESAPKAQLEIQKQTPFETETDDQPVQLEMSQPSVTLPETDGAPEQIKREDQWKFDLEDLVGSDGRLTPFTLSKNDPYLAVARAAADAWVESEDAKKQAQRLKYGFDEIDALGSAAAIEQFINENFSDNFAAPAMHYRQLMGRVGNGTATPAETTEYEYLSTRYQYARDLLSTQIAYESEQRMQQEITYFSAPLSGENLQERAAYGRTVDGNPLNDGWGMRLLSGRSSRVYHFATEQEKLLVDLHYANSKADGDAYVAWLDKYFLKDRSRSTVANFLVQASKLVPMVGPIPTRYWISAASSVEEKAVGIYNLGGELFGYDPAKGVLTEAYEQMSDSSPNWLDQKLLDMTHEYTADIQLAALSLAGHPYLSTGLDTLGNAGNQLQAAKSAGYSEGAAWALTAASAAMDLAFEWAIDVPSKKVEVMLPDVLKRVKQSPRGQASLTLVGRLMEGLPPAQQQRFFMETFEPVLQEIGAGGEMAQAMWTPEILEEAFQQQLEQNALRFALEKKGTVGVRELLTGQGLPQLPSPSQLQLPNALPQLPQLQLPNAAAIGGAVDGMAKSGIIEATDPTFGIRLPEGWTMQEGYDRHMVTGEVKKTGVSGAHNLHVFEQTILDYGGTLEECIVSRVDHPTIEGISDIYYQLPKKGSSKGDSWIIPGEYRIIETPKTTYDPKLYTDEEILRWGLEAMAEGISAGRINGDYVVGRAKNGLEFVGHISRKTGKLLNFYPTLN